MRLAPPFVLCALLLGPAPRLASGGDAEPALPPGTPASPVADDVDDQVRELFEKAARCEAEGDLDGADEALQAATALLQEAERPTAPADYRLGKLLYWNEVTEEGRALLYRANHEMPQDRDIAWALMDALLKDRDDAFGRGEYNVADAALDEARRALSGLEGEAAEDPGTRQRRARILARTAGEEVQAVDLYLALLRESPNDAAIHRELVQALPAAKCFDRVLGFYEGLDMDRGLRLWFQGETHVARAHALYNNQEDDEQALADYRAGKVYVVEAARFQPDYFDAAVEFGSFYDAWAGWVQIRLGRFADAWQSFRGALGRSPSNSSAIGGLEQLGFHYYDEDQIDQAREVYHELCYWQPDNPNHWNNYGLMCRDTGEYEEGFRAYLRAMQLAPQDPRLINDTALMLQYHLDRDLDLCESWLLRARELARDAWRAAPEPAVEEEMRAIYGDSLVNLWRLYDAQGKMEQAGAMRAELEEVDPRRPELGERSGR